MKRRITTFQSRLGKIQDNISKKVIDNNLVWAGLSTDTIRVRLYKNDEGDILDEVVESWIIAQVIYPKMENIPYRTLSDGKLSLTSLVDIYSEDANKNFIIQAPLETDLKVGDLLVRILLDDYNKKPIVLFLEIKEAIGSFGIHSIILSKFNCTLYTGKIGENFTKIIQDAVERRKYLDY